MSMVGRLALACALLPCAGRGQLSVEGITLENAVLWMLPTNPDVALAAQALDVPWICSPRIEAATWSARAEAALEEMRRFTADAAHEIRTPLSVIRESTRLGGVVEKLLMLARADPDETDLRLRSREGEGTSAEAEIPGTA
jgi:signal transduction histidine kinase